MEAELKKILKDGALDADFKKVMTKADSEITGVADLLTKKKANEIITMIRKWEYDKETDADKKARTVKVIKMNMDKKAKDVDPTDKEITEGLYKLAISEYKNKTDTEIQTWEKAEENGDDPNNQKMSAMKEWFGFGHVGKSCLAYGGIVVVLGLIT